MIVLGIVGWTHRWTTDDGFIYLRVVRELLRGHGPVFNPGQRVEAFTSPLWLALLALSDAVTPFRLEWIAVVLGIALTMAGGAFAIAGAALIARRSGDGELLLPVGLVVFVAVPATWYWESGGLEVGLVIGWIGLSVWLLARWAVSERRLSAGAAALLGLGWLVRPEVVVVSALFILAVLATQWRDDRWADRVRLVIAATALPIAYELFRMGYYGLLVANTAVAKEGTKTRFGQGWWYLEDFLRPYHLWIPLLFLAAGVYSPLFVRLRRRGEHRSVVVVGTVLFAAVVFAFSVVAYGGDYLHGRLLVPALFLVCAPVAVVPVARRYVAALVVVAWALLCAVALRPPELRHRSGLGPHDFALHYRRFVTVDDSGWNPASQARWFHGPAIYVQGHVFSTGLTLVREPAAPGVRLPAAVLQGIGAPSYAVGSLNVLDVHGLADPLTSHLRLVRRGYPGHEKTLPPPWIAAMLTAPSARPRAAEFPIADTPSTPYDTHAPFASEVAYARLALQCPAIRDLRESTTRPLTIGRFLGNIVHAFSRTTLRVPSDPKTAYAELCRRPRASAVRVAPARAGGAIVALARAEAPVRSWVGPACSPAGARRAGALAGSSGRRAAARSPPGGATTHAVADLLVEMQVGTA